MYHTVRGTKTFGLIFDPGASEALSGTQTVVEYTKSILQPSGLAPKIIASDNNTFVGIDGLPLPSGVRLGIPCNLGPSSFIFETETIGSTGDKCPMLLPNKSAIRHKMVAFHGYFDNGDGLLLMPQAGENNTPIALTMLLTDSGHYLIPLYDNFAKHENIPPNEVKKALQEVQKTLNKLSPHPSAKGTWFCSASGHWQKSTTESTIKSTYNNNATEGQNKDQTTVPTINDNNQPIIKTATTKPTYNNKAIEGQNNKKSITSTINNTSQEGNNNDIDPPPGLVPISEFDTFDENAKAFNLDPSTCACCQADENSESLTPCIICYSPVCISCQTFQGCRDCLADKSEANLATKTNQPSICTAGKGYPSDEFIKKLTMNQGILRNWCNDHYQQDSFPAELNSSKLRNKMRHVPEEFYKVSKNNILTPDNAKLFIAIHARWAQLTGKQLNWDFWEHDAGSCRCSGKAWKKGMAVGPPIDCRFGWNYDRADHRQLITTIHNMFMPIFELHAPECTLFCKGSAQRDPEVLATERTRLVPAQEWRRDHIIARHKQGLGILLENPFPSEIYKITPLATLLDYMKLRHGSQCTLGAVCPVTGLPIRKETTFISNLPLRHTIRPCQGHDGTPHGALQGRDPRTGLLLTQLASRYPHRMADAIVLDAASFVCKYRSSNITTNTKTNSTFANHQVPGTASTKQILGTKRKQGPPIRAEPVSRAAPSSPMDEAAEDPPSSDEGELHDAVIVDDQPPDLDDNMPLEALLPQQQQQQVNQPGAEEAPEDEKPFISAKPGNLQVLGFGLKDAIKRLAELETEEQQVKGLLSLHGRFWHASLQKMMPLLQAAGAASHLIQLLPKALKMCAQCQQFAPPKHRPTFKTTLAKYFNHMVQADSFEALGDSYLLLVDELYQFKSGEQLDDQSYDSYAWAAISSWIRFFGPPACITSDQGGALASDDFAAFCDKYNINRILAGSDPSHGGTKGAKHTKTGLVEKHVDLTRLTMLKLHAYMQELGIEVLDKRILFYETCCSHNILLMVNGVAPIVGVLGNLPRDYHDLGNSSVANFEGSTTDIAEYSTKVRLLAKVAALRSIVERRLVQAEKSRPHKFQASELQVGSLVDLYRVPKNKDTSGWRGPAVILDLDIPAGTATIKYQSRVYLVPLRHLRPHAVAVAFFGLALQQQGQHCHDDHSIPLIYHAGQQPSPIVQTNHLQHLLHPAEMCGVREFHHCLHNDVKTAYQAGQSFAHIMDLVDNLIPGKPFLAGRIHTPEGWRTVQIDSPIFTSAKQLDLHFPFDGIRAGTRMTMLPALPEARDGLLVTWHRNAHSQYNIKEINPSRPIPFKTMHGKIWHDMSFFILFRYVHIEDDRVKAEAHETDETNIEWIPEDDDSDLNSLFKGFDADDASMLPPSDPSWPHHPFDATMQEPDISDESMLPPPSPGPKPPPDDRLDPNKIKTTIKQHAKTRSTTNKPTITIKNNPKLNKSNSTLPPVPEHDDFQPDDESMQQQPTSQRPQLPTHDRSRSILRPSRASSSNQPINNNNNNNSLDISTSTNKDNSISSITGDVSAINNDNSLSITGEVVPWVEDDPNNQTLEYQDGQQIPVENQQPLDVSSPNTTNEQSTLQYWSDVLEQVQHQIHFRDSTECPAWLASEAAVVIPGPWKANGSSPCFFMSITTGECYRVDEATDILSPQELVTFENDVKEADRAEIASFIQYKVFECARKSTAKYRPMMCIWVRRWKFKGQGSEKRRIIKSRLCVRGFLDPQKQGLSKHSSTASRISQRLAISLTVNLDFELESWDISAAFLQGFTFNVLASVAAELGVDIRNLEREAYIECPGNVWFHLKQMKFPGVPSHNLHEWCFKLLKPMYGLCDAPLLWQLCLRHFVVKFLRGKPSIYDDNFYFWRADNSSQDPLENNQYNKSTTTTSNRQITAIMTAHVDDTLTGANKQTLEWLRTSLERRFGDMKRQTLPFGHVGLTIERMPGGLFIHQEDFCNSLQPCKIDKERAKQTTARCTPVETTALRSGLGGLMYLAQTRPEIAAELVTMMTIVNEATVADLKQLNTLINRAKQTPKRGIKMFKINPPFRELVVSDASHASSKTVYAKEGQLLLLTSDESSTRLPKTAAILSAQQLNDLLTGPTQLLYYSSKKSSRVSHSTSHAESLGSHSAIANAELISARFTELYSPYPMSLDDMIRHDEKLPHEIPVDLVGDAKDVLELVTGERGVPLDTTQRIIILSLRERRLLRKLRCMYTISTFDMIANRLTKYDAKDNSLEEFLDSGHLTIRNQGFFRPAAKTITEFTEQDLIRYKEDSTIVDYANHNLGQRP